ncbi:hypothetical protein IM977_004689 [Salmonella enterica subsp. enterica serovar Typhimurium]|nr:hypothetical protein [Salmonella enterica subsp. enterica serovar Typhimurium]
MKLNAQIIDLIQFASGNKYPVYVGVHDVTIDALSDGRFLIYYGDGMDVVLISRKKRYGTANLITDDEFRSLIYRRLHGVPDLHEADYQTVSALPVSDDKKEDNYYEYL